MIKLLLSVLVLSSVSCGKRNLAPENSNIPKTKPSRGLTVTSMNIKWYGVGERLMDNPRMKDETSNSKNSFQNTLEKLIFLSSKKL